MTKNTLLALLASTALLACSKEAPVSQTEAPATSAVADFTQQMQLISQDYFKLRPEIATYYGVPDEKAGAGAMSSLGEYSSEGEKNRRAGFKAVLEKLAALDRTDLSDTQRISLELIEIGAGNASAPADVVDYGVVLGDYGNWFSPYPVSHLVGPHVEIPAILEDKMAVRNPTEAEAYLARLDGYAAVLDDVIEKIAHDRELGAVPPDFVIDRVIANLGQAVEKPAAESTLVTSFTQKLAQAEVDGVEEYTTRAVALVDEKIFPATRRLIDAMTALRPLSTHEAGVSRLPNGEAFYRAMITHMTDTTMGAEEIHALGLSEVDRIHAEMDTLLRKIGYAEGSVGERMSDMLRDPRYLYSDSDEGREQLLADMQADLDMANEKLPLWFGTVPDQAVAIRVVPPHRSNSGSGAYYDAPSMDGSRPGTYWIDLTEMESVPSYSLQTLTYHEANPGHHLQTIIGLDDSLPILGTVFYSNAAGEGWGLYAEYLASEMGLYEGDPVDDIGRLQAELHRAVRLVVDTGMHAKGWSRERAIDYSVATEGIHLSEATAEIERYAVWPAQALGYKLGMLKILQLRERARKQLGERFDIREFHDQVLEEGALPLNLMEEKIDRWIASQL